MLHPHTRSSDRRRPSYSEDKASHPLSFLALQISGAEDGVAERLESDERVVPLHVLFSSGAGDLFDWGSSLSDLVGVCIYSAIQNRVR